MTLDNSAMCSSDSIECDIMDIIILEQREADLWSNLKEAKIFILSKKIDQAYVSICRLKN